MPGPIKAETEVQSGEELPEYEYVIDETIDPSMILGGIEGPTRTHHTITITQGETHVQFTEPRHTQYVLIQTTDGQLEVQRWDHKAHGHWQDIPQIGGSISDFIGQLEGFGEREAETHAGQFRRVTRSSGTAMHTFDSTQAGYEKRGAIRGHRLDHSGGRALIDTGHKMSKTEARRLKENPDFVIPIPGTSFAFDASRNEIVRDRQKNLKKAA